MDEDTGQVTPLGQMHRELWEGVRDAIRESILSGDLRPGQRLSEPTLARRFDVSRGPVRTALRELERVGLVNLFPRRGAEVITFTPQDLEELHNVDMALERMAAREAAPRLAGLDGKAMVRSMQGLLRDLGAAQDVGDVRGAAEADLSFHRAICRAAGNKRLLNLWEQISEQIRLVITLTQRTIPAVGTARVHERLLLVLASGDSDAAEEAIQQHVNEAHQAIVNLPPRAIGRLLGQDADEVAAQAAARR